MSLAVRLHAAMASADSLELSHLAGVDPDSRRDRFLTLLEIYAIKQRCESCWLVELDEPAVPQDIAEQNPLSAVRMLAVRDRLPEVYKWLAREASWVHTTLHQRMAEAIEMPRLPNTALPTSALARTALGGLLSTNRWLQPEALGALGLIELQAGPRCRLVLQAFERCGAPAAAYDFYAVHAEVDPRHGKNWLDNAIAPTLAESPDWGARILRGAYWRSTVNAEFVRDVAELLGAPGDSTAGLAAAS